MSALDRFLDLAERTWRASCDVPAEEWPAGMHYVVDLLGQLVDRERPGLADRVVEEVCGER